jgi:hypothetical protein
MKNTNKQLKLADTQIQSKNTKTMNCLLKAQLNKTGRKNSNESETNDPGTASTTSISLEHDSDQQDLNDSRQENQTNKSNNKNNNENDDNSNSKNLD